MRRNYDAKLSASIYYVAENVVIIGILAYPKITMVSGIVITTYPLKWRISV